MSSFKIFNDPVYGFVKVPRKGILDLVEHPFFQRLRNINQLGLTHLVYPGSLHTRFHHALGALHLMTEALEVIQQKGTRLTAEEHQGAQAAILLHDIGHGPFSHALEHTLTRGVSHEFLSQLMMRSMNQQLNGALHTAMAIFNDTYPKKFLHQLVSGQLDMDRMDYLSRDSFYTGVSEGVIGTERILKMLTISGDDLVVEEKGVYSIEKFIVARRLMYWQVYLHKTVLAAENMLIRILERARELAGRGQELWATPWLHFFLYQDVNKERFVEEPECLQYFTQLDDHDIVCGIKMWANHVDPVLSKLCRDFLARRIFKIDMKKEAFTKKEIGDLQDRVRAKLKLDPQDIRYFVFAGSTGNHAYNLNQEQILILMKDGSVKDISEASDNLNISTLGQKVEKHYLCRPHGF